MPEKILLIQPRWMKPPVALQKIEALREKYPRARFFLLAATPAALPLETITCWPLPPLEPRAMINFAGRLRAVRFRRALVLTDAGQGDVGYGEAKLWAFAANARRREFDGKGLTLWREAKAKRKVVAIFGVHFLAVLCRLFQVSRRAESLAPPVWMQSARTFVYLQHAAHQHGALPGRVLLIGDCWDEMTAQRCGWQPVRNEKTSEPLELTLVDGVTTKKKESLPTLPTSKLLCFAQTMQTATASITPQGWGEVETRAAFFDERLDEQAGDIWLVRQG